MDDREDGAFFLDALADSSDESSVLADERFHGVRTADEAASTVKNSTQAKDLEQLDTTVAAPEQALEALAFLESQKKAPASQTRTDLLVADEPPSDLHSPLMQALDSTDMADRDYGLVDSIDELDSTIVVHGDDLPVDDEFDATMVCDLDEGLLLAERLPSSGELCDLDATVLLAPQPDSAGFLQEFDAVAPAPPVIAQLGTASGARASATANARTDMWVETPPLRSRGASGTLYFVLAVVVFLGAYFYTEQIRAFFSSVSAVSSNVAVPSSAAGVAPLSAGQQADEIRYCISQGIRLNSAADNVAGLGRVAVSRLQSMFDVYDKRCSDRNFDPADYVATYLSVDAERARIEQQGIALLSTDLMEAAPVANPKNPEQPVTLKLLDTQNPVEAVAVELPAGVSAEVVSVPPDNTIPLSPANAVASAAWPEAAGVFSSIFSDTESSHRTVKDIQWRLFKLGFYNGRFDGVFADSTRESLLAFFRDSKIAATTRDVASYSEKEIFRLVDRAYTNW